MSRLTFCFLLIVLATIVGATPPKAYLVKDIAPSYRSSSPRLLVDVGGRLFFVADDNVLGRELWTTDGTEEGTYLVKDIDPTGGPPPSGRGSPSNGEAPNSLVPMGGRLYFSADEGTDGRELWTSDGTSPGTHQLADIAPGPPSGTPDSLVATSSLVFFRADDLGREALQRELWRSDGTPKGTGVLVRGAPTSTDIGVVANLFRVQESLYFQLDDGIVGRELWRSDGTLTGTEMVEDINPGPGSSSPSELVWDEARTRLFFGASDGTSFNLYRLDVPDGRPLVIGKVREFHALGFVGDVLLFVNNDGEHGLELWATDGTPGSLSLVADIRPGSVGSYPAALGVLGQALLFAADDGVHGTELWRSDGTTRGTRLLLDIYSGAAPGLLGAGGTYGGLLAAGQIFFQGRDPSHGGELWASDGTEEGTAMLADIQPGPDGGNPLDLTLSGDRLYFTANTDLGRELWAWPLSRSRRR